MLIRRNNTRFFLALPVLYCRAETLTTLARDTDAHQTGQQKLTSLGLRLRPSWDWRNETDGRQKNPIEVPGFSGQKLYKKVCKVLLCFRLLLQILLSVWHSLFLTFLPWYGLCIDYTDFCVFGVFLFYFGFGFLFVFLVLFGLLFIFFFFLVFFFFSN